jgi:DNA-binding Lrp family transcriptional regulator
MDAVDIRILEELRLDGRIGQNELAAKLGISRPTVSKHLAALLDRRHVQIVGVVHPSTIGIDAIAHIAISVNQPVRRVAELLAQIPDVPFVSLTSGRYPLLVEVRAIDSAALTADLDRIRSVDGVVDTNTLVYSDLVIDIGRPERAPSIPIDKLDMALLAALQEDGRASYRSLGELAGISAGTARMRVKRLMDEGVVRIGALSRVGQGETEFAVGFGVRLTGPAASVSDLLVDLPGLHFLAATFGRFDLLGTVHTANLNQIVNALDSIRALRQVLEVDSWVHLETIKERYDYARPYSEERIRS